jgi:hypothetical protein
MPPTTVAIRNRSAFAYGASASVTCWASGSSRSLGLVIDPLLVGQQTVFKT